MQTFLGAALFFQTHVPNYSEWAAHLYQMTHETFNWDPETWTFDYKRHFEEFKDILMQAQELHFPNYELPWVLRSDASQYAVGSVLYQLYTPPGEDEAIPQPINFTHTRFSKPALNWDTYKKEAFAIYHGVFSNVFLLRGKAFLAQTDHRNLKWIEASQSPIVIRWRALLQSFSFVVEHISGSENRVADYMSRHVGDPDFMYLLDDNENEDSHSSLKHTVCQTHVSYELEPQTLRSR
jgi:hypothetical protein